MTRAFSGSNIIKFSVFVGIVRLPSSINVAEADVAVSNATGYRVTVRSEASSLSSMAATRHVPTDENVQQSSANEKHTGAVPNLVEAPVEVIGPRVVESRIRGKVERKRETGIGIGTSTRDLGYDDGRHACVLSEDGKLKESSYKVHNGKTITDVTGIVRTSAKRDARSRDVDHNEYQVSGDPKIQVNNDEDDEDDDEDDVVLDDDEVRRNPRRKAGRRYRQGPKIWDQWGKWTSCSVSCGAGKLTRWRHCIAGGCSMGEKEAQLKTCTFSAC